MPADLHALTLIEEQVLRARLDSVRAAIAHSGEKGRDLELHVHRLLRDLLPPEYGLTTGFIASQQAHGIELTGQLDLIIFDAQRYAPLIRLESCDVLPLEAVYGYVEVKATVRALARPTRTRSSDSLDDLAQQNAAIRALRTRVYHQVVAGSPPEIETKAQRWLAPRAYVFAFEVKNAKNPDTFAQRLALALERAASAHLHGILVPGYGFFYTRPVNPESTTADDHFRVKYTTDHPLLAFKSLLLEGLATFPRAPASWSPAIDRYLSHSGQWREQSPRTARGA